jgi:putative FmdB family regulatory protein
MPTYEYVCTSCGNRLEAVQPFSDPALTTCPVCQGVLRKVFGNVGIVLKGSGFYKNDSRSSARSNGFGPAKETSKEKESGSTGEPSTKDSSTKDSSGKDSGPTKDAPASTPASSSTGGSGASEKAAASSS